MILLLGGTGDARKLLQRFESLGEPVIYTAATDYGAKLAKADVKSEVLVGSQILDELPHREITVVVDATHPYSWKISKAALSSACKFQIPYLRFERRSALDLDDLTYNGAILVQSQKEAAEILSLKDGTVFLTTGSKELEVWSILNPSRLVVRVLPTSEAIEKCIRLGLSPKQIIGMQGPFSVSENEWMFRRFKADYVVLKDGGELAKAGERVLAAKRCGAVPVVVARPHKIDFPESYGEMEPLVRRVLEILNGGGRDER